MYFPNSYIRTLSLVIFFLTVRLCGVLVRCEESLSFNQRWPLLKEINQKFEKKMNITTKLSGSVQLGASDSFGDCADGTGRSQEGGELLRGLFRLLGTCLLRSKCYQERLLVALDRALEADTLRLADGIYLVKESPQEQRFESGTLESEPYLAAVTRRLIRLLQTHALRVRLGVMRDTVSQVRGFHRGYRHAFPMMVGSFMLLAAVTVPMGFQFLAVIGGKALILSQIALFLALGGNLQRFMGWGVASPGGGLVQHDYYLRDDLRPWHREGSDEEVSYLPQNQQQLHISHQQLQRYMNRRRVEPRQRTVET